MKRFLKAVRLFWFALRYPSHEDAEVARRVAKAEILPRSTYLFNLDSPTTTRTWEWLGRDVLTVTVTNPFYWPDYPEGSPPNL